MEKDKLIEIVENSCPARVENIVAITGGYRNEVFRISLDDKRTLIVKKHKVKPYFDFFSNEVQGYQILQSRRCRVPQLIFQDPTARILGLEDLEKPALEENLAFDKYAETIRLLIDTQERTKSVDLPQNLFYRDPVDIYESLTTFSRLLSFIPSAKFSRFVDSCHGILNSAPRRLTIGSFIPANVVRTSEDYHVDLEMVSRGTDTDDLAYFALFSGSNPNKLFEMFNSERTLSIDQYRASLLHLSLLASAVYLKDLEEVLLPQTQRKIIKRLANFATVLNSTDVSEFKELSKAMEAYHE